MEAFGGMFQGVNEVTHQGLCDFSRVLEILTHGIKWVHPFFILNLYVVKCSPWYF
jgi:hypothetical protein